MYCRQKPFKEENYKPKKTHRNTPSFSSTLLDEIYRSIDGNDAEKCDKPAAARSGFTAKNGGATSKKKTHEELMPRFPRACLVEKWMEKELFSSTSTSSDSSCAPSSSDNEFFANSLAKSKCSRINTKNHQKSKLENDLVRPKSKASKFYAKLKQPISPGGRLTNFLNSIFTKKQDSNKGFDQDLKLSSTPSICSTDQSRDKMRNHGIQRTVRFHPVIHPEPNGNKNMCNEKHRRPPLPPHVIKTHQNRGKCDFSVFGKIQNNDEDDRMSDSSSDLFELDHMTMYGNDRLFEELPVYETTYLDKNSGLFG